MIENDLYKKAETAIPPCREDTDYKSIYPIAEKLRNNGFNIQESVNWLIEHGAWAKERERSLYQALQRFFAKKRKTQEAK